MEWVIDIGERSSFSGLCECHDSSRVHRMDGSEYINSSTFILKKAGIIVKLFLKSVRQQLVTSQKPRRVAKKDFQPLLDRLQHLSMVKPYQL